MGPWNAFCAIMKETCIYYIRAQSLNYIYMHVLLLHIASQLKKEKNHNQNTWEINVATYEEKLSCSGDITVLLSSANVLCRSVITRVIALLT